MPGRLVQGLLLLLHLQNLQPEVALRLPHKTVMAHGSRIFCFVGPFEPYDFHHVAETGIASPHTLKPRNPITLAIEVSAQFCNNDQGFTE
jgi:hypothetical protein